MLITNIRVYINLGLVFLISFVLMSCQIQDKKELTKEAYTKEINEKKNGFFTKKINKVEYMLLYKPLDYMIINENKNRDISSLEMDSLRKEYGSMEYYTLEINIEDFKDEILKYKILSPVDYNERVDYYAFKFQNDISMEQDGKKYLCKAYHFERNYGLSPKAKFILAFDKMDDKKNRTIEINEKYLGSGIIKYTITPEDLEKLPILKLN